MMRIYKAVSSEILCEVTFSVEVSVAPNTRPWVGESNREVEDLDVCEKRET